MFLCCLTMSIEYSQENHVYYRKLIHNYINNNKDLLKDFFLRFDNESEDKFQTRYDTLFGSIEKEGTYAGDFELTSSSIALQKRIIVFREDIKEYRFINIYVNFLNNNINLQNIYLLYKNNNHFNLLGPKNEYSEIGLEIEQNFDKIHI